MLIAAAEEIPAALRDHWEDVTTAMHDADARRLYVDVAEPLAKRALLTMRRVEADGDERWRALARRKRTRSGAFRWRYSAPRLPTSAARSITEAEAQLEKELRCGYRVVVTFETQGEAERARYNLNRVDARFLGRAPRRTIRPCSSPRRRSATASSRPELRLAVIPFRRLVHRRRAAAPGPARGAPGELRRPAGRRLRRPRRTTGSPASPASRRRRSPGSPATTSSSSTAARTRSSRPPTSSRRSPATSAPAATPPQLSALGSKRWDAVKARARRAARELAGELLNLYAERQARKGHAFEPDGEWQLELERSFPYRETADQIDAIEAVKADMESERPMDRLICGDVGYGKTEVALRAAHKAAAEGKQVMMLVPTTILAQQHLGTFRERLADRRRSRSRWSRGCASRPRSARRSPASPTAGSTS